MGKSEIPSNTSKESARPYLLAAPFTAMHRDGSLNLDAVERQMERLVDTGVSGAFVCGTAGESMSLTVGERMLLAARWQELAASAGGSFRIVVHTGHPCLEDAKTLTRHAETIGASGFSAMAPFFFRPANTEELAVYCAELTSTAPDLPFLYYHFPSMTGVEFPVADFLERAVDRIPNLSGVKFTHWDLSDFSRCALFRSGRFEMLLGRDEVLIGGLSLGARGAIGSTYNYGARIYSEAIDAFRAGDMAAALAWQSHSLNLVRIFSKYSAIPAQKAIMKMAGIDCGPVRLPLIDLTQAQCGALRRELEESGLLDLIDSV